MLVDDDLSWNHVNRLIATRNNKRGSKYLDEQAEMLENELGTDDNEAREMAFKLVEFASLPEMHEGDKLPEVLLLKLIGEVRSMNKLSESSGSKDGGGGGGGGRGPVEEVWMTTTTTTTAAAAAAAAEGEGGGGWRRRLRGRSSRAAASPTRGVAWCVWDPWGRCSARLRRARRPALAWLAGSYPPSATAMTRSNASPRRLARERRVSATAGLQRTGVGHASAAERRRSRRRRQPRRSPFLAPSPTSSLLRSHRT